jgi:hypothetical protein
MKSHVPKYTKILATSYFALMFLFYFFTPSVQAVSASTPNLQWIPPKLQILDKIPGWNLNTTAIDCKTVGNQTVCAIPWISQMINSVYKYLLGAVGIVAAVAMMVGGLLWLTAGGNSGRVTQAKGIINGSLIGMILAFTTYFILYQINPELTNLQPIRVTMINKAPTTNYSTYAGSNYTGCDAYTVECSSKGLVNPQNNSLCEGKADFTSAEQTYYCCCAISAKSGCSWQTRDCNADTETDIADGLNYCGTKATNYKCCCTKKTEITVEAAEARKLLEQAGFKLNNANLSGIQQQLISELTNFKSQYCSGCGTIDITSVTDGSHAPCSKENGYTCHTNGMKADLALSTKLNDTIINGFDYYGYRTGTNGGDMYQSPNGGCYTNENGHWDMTYNSCSVWGGKKQTKK